MGKLDHEESFSHFADVKTIDFGCGIVSELSIIYVDISEFSHAEVLATEILKLYQRLLRLVISTNLINKDASFTILAIRI